MARLLEIRRSMAIVYCMVTTRGTAEYARLALRSFFEHTPLGRDDLLLLVDDDGQFEVPEALTGPYLRLVRNPRPRSFAANANLALHEARERMADLVLLHDDVVFTPGWLRPLLASGRTLAAPASNAEYPGALGSLSLPPGADPAALAGLDAELHLAAERHARQVRGRRRVAVAPCRCVRIPQAVWANVGSFDERFAGRAAGWRDFALRLWLAGSGHDLALDSFVVHLQAAGDGGSGCQSGPQDDGGDTAAFAAKWGPSLAYAFMGDDWNLFLSDPSLRALIAARRFDAAIEHLRTHPAIEPFIASQQVAKFAAVCVVYEDDSWLACTLEPVYDLCDSIWFFVNDRPWYGEPTDQAPMLERIRRIPDPAGKFRVVEGHWTDEIQPRNEALQRLGDAGIDYCFVLDADEIWDPAVLGQAMDVVRQNPQVALWRAGCYTYWKSPAFRVDPPEPYRAVVFLRVGAGRFTYSRDGDAGAQAAFPIEQVAFHHMSYARSDEVVRRKIDGCTHKFDVVPGWYENVWLKWDANPEMQDVHPCWPSAYHRVIPQPPAALPPSLRRWTEREAALAGR
jgi:GT2 family glycosyltransferase